MAFEPDKITKEHILNAVKKIEKEAIEFEPSIKFDVLIDGKAYPPKEVMRYAHLLANGSKEWEPSGGPPTNKYLEKFGFEIVSKADEALANGFIERFVEILKKIGQENANDFFEIAIKLVDKLKLKEGDDRLTYGTSSGNRLSITIGQRYCIAFVPSEELPWQFINEKSIKNSENIRVGKFQGSPEAYFYRCSNSFEMSSRLTEITSAAEIELNRTELSGYRKSNNAQFEKAIFDEKFRKELFDAAFGNGPSLTGNVWKLGCRWGSKMPSFYEFIKKRSIVIGVNDKLYSPGDLIVITEGHKVLALGKVLEIPKPVTDVPEFEEEFDPFEIDYNPRINYSKVEWYELAEDEVFTYQLQQGICRVNVPYVRDAAITIWKDRFINYWVFQCNPAEFDFDSAVRKKLLNEWTVTAHKDKIKRGDKVIIWLTGKKAGCYALARITGDPIESKNSTDNHLWKTESKDSLKAGIELTHNLLDRPLYWQSIKDTEGLQDLKVGTQGTNFSATRKQYNSLIKLIEKNMNMSSKLDLGINSILYGPPGTGKTYKLNEYKDEYFTDRGISKTSEEVLRDRVESYPFWKVLGAVLGTSKQALSVKEIIDHPLIKAKIKPANKTKPNAIAWGNLQAYADDNSTQMDAKYRRPIKIFQKDKESKWSILGDKKTELGDIIDQELLDIAANPKLQAVQSTDSKIRFNFITFHQKYSYEDFIEGIKPLLNDGYVDEEREGTLQFELKKGIFYNSCLEALKLVGYESFSECHDDKIENRIAKFNSAKNDSSKQFALFIDEINRANISAVFGELITLLEDDKRIGADNEMWVELPYSNEKFCVPANLYLIGTMNTADRSIALLDIALRRRFEFISLYPLYPEGEWWAPLLEKINLAIHTWKKNPDFFIGHAFFMNKLETDRIKILNTKIVPLLCEYCQNNSDTVKKILSEAGVQVKQTGIKENFQIVAE